MKYSIIPLAQTVVRHCKERGLKNVVISPGSRSAPLVLGFTSDPFFNCFSIVDERCAAFFALGIAQQLREAVALVCTSGSALLNYYPAVAEAFYSNIPLLIFSADRPLYKIDIGDGQTIRQEGVFANHILYSAALRQDLLRAGETKMDPPAEAAEEKFVLQGEIQAFNDQQLYLAFLKCIRESGPVHLNVPFEEPLYQSTDLSLFDTKLDSLPPEVGPALPNLESFAEQWNTSARKMILCGTLFPGSVEEEYLQVLARDPSVLLFTETTSNVHHPDFFPSIDSVLAPLENTTAGAGLAEELKPDILLTLGGMIVSKKIKAFLRTHRPVHHWHVDPLKAYDTFFCLSGHFKADVNTFFHCFLPLTQTVKSNYRSFWEGRRKEYRKKRKAYLRDLPFSDFLAFAMVFQSLPPLYQLQLANSSTVRYSQLFDLPPTVKVFCNRGTSGIDGSTATALGASLYSGEPTLLLSGDLSFLYDSNGLWNSSLREDFRIIVINNQGGGIFRILPGMEESGIFERYFETVQQLDISKICGLYGMEHRKVIDSAQLAQELTEFYEPSMAPKVLEIKTPRLLNNKVLLAYFDYLAQN